VEQMGVHRNPVSSFAPGSEAAKAYARLWQCTKERLGLA
jgi:hypothetical protein